MSTVKHTPYKLMTLFFIVFFVFVVLGGYAYISSSSLLPVVIGCFVDTFVLLLMYCRYVR